jgi:hypothetical protein
MTLLVRSCAPYSYSLGRAVIGAYYAIWNTSVSGRVTCLSTRHLKHDKSRFSLSTNFHRRDLSVMSSSEENFDIDGVSGSESDDYRPAAKKVRHVFGCLWFVVFLIYDRARRARNPFQRHPKRPPVKPPPRKLKLFQGPRIRY